MKFDLSSFFHHKEHQSLSADASELGLPVGASPSEKITIENKKTGKAFDFLLFSRFRQQDGEIYNWKFYPVDQDGCPVKKVVIYND